MTTNLDEPVILATLTDAGGEPAGPLLIDGYALPVIVRLHGPGNRSTRSRAGYARSGRPPGHRRPVHAISWLAKSSI